MTMDTLWGGLTFAPGESFPLSTDSMVLADFVRLPKAAQVADLGSGGGVLGLLLCGRYSDCTVTGVELCQQAIRQLWKTLTGTGWAGYGASWGT